MTLKLTTWLLSAPETRRKLDQDKAFRLAPKTKRNVRIDHLDERQKSIDYWRACLTKSIDGRGLWNASRSRESSEWVLGIPGFMRGNEYIRALHVRFALLKTRLRAARGRVGLSPRDVKCPSCTDSVSSLAHILQSCGRTHGFRIKRHDNICDLLAKAAGRKGWSVAKEPIIRAGATLKGALKPDLVLYKGSRVVIVDPTVVSDQADLRKEAEAKVELYDVPRVKQYCAEVLVGKPVADIAFVIEGLPLTWRGIVDRASWRRIAINLGLNTHTLSLLVLRCLVASWKTWHFDQRCRTSH